uniref:hypothetical protein n=1 Tax=Hylemonella sp. TaxID=2066020 RepID=UPI003918DCBD
MHHPIRIACGTVAGLVLVLALILWADATLPPEQFPERVLPRTFQNGEVFFIVPCTGGGIASCALSEPPSYPPGTSILITRTSILGRCTVAPLPEGWQRKRCA